MDGRPCLDPRVRDLVVQHRMDLLKACEKLTSVLEDSSTQDSSSEDDEPFPDDSFPDDSSPESSSTESNVSE